MSDTINKNFPKAEEFPMHPTREAEKIICFLAENGPANIYQVSKGTGVNYPTTHKNIKKSERWKIVRFECEVNSEKGGKSKVYGLTLLGLCYVFWSGKLLDTLDDIIEKWKHLDALLLANWKNLISIGPREEAVDAIKFAAADVWHCASKLYEAGAIKNDEDIQPVLWNEFSGRLIGIYSDYNRQKWIEAMHSIPTLKEWMKEYYQKSLSHAQNLVRWDNKVLQALEGEEADLKDVTEQVQKTWEELTTMYFKNASESFVKSIRMESH